MQSDPRKARPWFERAHTVADARNYEYAIECFINGLRHEPDAIAEHEALREVALKRKVNEGKPAGMIEQMKFAGGKTPLDKMLNAEYLWSKDPFNPQYALTVMENAVRIGAEEVAYWVGELVVDANQKAKKPNKQVYVKAKDLFRELQAFDKAAEACQLALQMDPNNDDLAHELRDLQTEATMVKAKYGESFQESIRDADKQRALEADDAIAATGSQIEDRIQRLRQEYEDNPEDGERAVRLVRALLERQDKESEEEAIKLLEESWERTGQYRFKMQIGDIRMRQYNRAIRELRKRMEQKPEEREELQEKLRRLATAQVKFELNEYAERVKNYPTDMGLKFQLGRRQLALGQYDDAIASFQEAQSDPKHRAASLRYLGEAFAAKEWHDEAIDTFRRGIDAHERSDDRTALELRYDLMNSLEQKARENDDREAAQEAAQIASQIAQTDINFKDIRSRVDALRKLSNELKSKQSS